jgi:protein involved in polysaccharide export with SLBB domain
MTGIIFARIIIIMSDAISLKRLYLKKTHCKFRRIAGIALFATITVIATGCIKRLPEGEAGGATMIDKATFLKLANVPKDSLASSSETIHRADELFPNDVVSVTIYDKLPASQEKRDEIKRINEDGVIFILPAGDTRVGGLTLSQAEKAVEEKLAAFVVSPHVEISVVKRSYEPRIYVFGEVGKQGMTLLKPGDRLLDAISSAGGCGSNAYRRSIKIIRPQGTKVVMISINLIDILGNGRMDENLVLQDQDLLFVPRRFYTNFNEVMSVIASLVPWYYFAANFK